MLTIQGLDVANEISQKRYFDLLELALTYARRGWPVLPLHIPLGPSLCSCQQKDCKSIGKHPRVPNGLKDATTDLNIIQCWWEKWPRSNIGIVTGSLSKLIVVDVDKRHGGDQS